MACVYNMGTDSPFQTQKMTLAWCDNLWNLQMKKQHVLNNKNQYSSSEKKKTSSGFYAEVNST